VSRKIKISFILFTLFFVCLSFYFSSIKKTQIKYGRVIIKDKTIYVEIVKKKKDLIKGLSKRDKLEENHGMLFIFPKADYWSFWMKEMKFPLDIIWINNNRIVYLKKNVPLPFKEKNITIYKPKRPAKYVLEVNAGLSDKYNWQIGDLVKIFDKN